MGILLSSCIPNLHSKISYLSDNYKDFDIVSSQSDLRIKKINNNLESRTKSFNTFEDYWSCRKFNEINLNSDKDDYSDKFIKPKNMPRYNFESLKNEIFAQEMISEKETKVPVVLMHSVLLEGFDSKKSYLALGTVLNVLYREDNWLYVQTADHQEGYIDSKSCIPLDILSLSSSEENIQISKMENYLHSITSEKITNIQNFNNSKLQCTEQDFDLLYLKLTKNSIQSTEHNDDVIEVPTLNDNIQKTVILIIKTDYTSNAKDTLSVKKGEIVILVHCCVKGWFWVKNKSNMEGFIPAATAGYWCR